MQRLLAIFPHPDDETFIAGGTLSLATASDIDVRVLSLTRGENGWDRTGIHTDPAALGTARSAEFSNAIARLGVNEGWVLDFNDGALTERAEQLEATITAEISDFLPDTVLTFGCDGAYGHTDHIASWAATQSVLVNCKLDTRPLHVSATTDGPAIEKLWRALSKLKTAGAPLVVADYPSRRASFRAKRSWPLDIECVARRKLSALAEHRTQLMNDDARSFLKPEVTERLLREEVLTFESGDPAAFGKLIRTLSTTADNLHVP